MYTTLTCLFTNTLCQVVIANEPLYIYVHIGPCVCKYVTRLSVIDLKFVDSLIVLKIYWVASISIGVSQEC